jgi:hypothetical protein
MQALGSYEKASQHGITSQKTQIFWLQLLRFPSRMTDLPAYAAWHKHEVMAFNIKARYCHVHKSVGTVIK